MNGLPDRKKSLVALAGLIFILAAVIIGVISFGPRKQVSGTAPSTIPPTAVDIPVTPPASIYIPFTKPEPINVSQKPIPAQLVIRFSPDASLKQRSTYIESVGGVVRQNIDALDTVVVSVSAETAAQPLPTSPLVLESAPDYYVSALDAPLPPNDPRYAEQWALPAIHAPEAWSQLPAGADPVTVAVIDSGICADHPDLAGRIGSGWDFVENDAVPQDEYGHGCSVSGLLAANMNDGKGIAGMAPNASIMPLRVLNASGIGSYSDVAAAIVFAADHGAQIINLSLGGPNSSTTMQNAVNYALSKGVILVAAAGNSGTQGALYPAAYPGVIAVGSLDPNLQPSVFSNFGSRIDVWAPGRDILTTRLDGGYGLASGTSFAAPYVSGAQAIAIGLHQSLALAGAKLNMLSSAANIPGISPATPTSTLADQPNLKVFSPAGWAAPLIVSPQVGANTSGTLLTNQDIYISWAVTNTGGDVSLPFKTCLNYDSVSLQCWKNDGLAAGASVIQTDWVLTIPTSVGVHHIEIVTDTDNAIAESNKLDNTWGADFEWKAGATTGLVSGPPLINDVIKSPVVLPLPQGANASSAPGSTDTSDYMLGSLTIGIIMPESTGAQQNWTTARRDQVISKIQTAVNWWRQQAYTDYGITIPVEYDIHYAVPTTYEPITTASDDGWISNVMTNMGYNIGDKYARVNSYLNTIRAQRGTNWAFTFFVVDSTNDADGKFADGSFAYTYAGKSFTVMTTKNGGWGLANMDKVAAHEMAHDFGAGDNYYDTTQGGCPNTTDPYGYLGIPNSNCMNGNPSAVIDVLMNNLSWVLHPSTAQQVGWRDSNSNKLMDPVDTQPGIDMLPYAPNPAGTNQLTYSGSAFDNPTPHFPYDSTMSTYGFFGGYQDVTINTITAVQYRVDGGAWTAADAVDGYFNSDFEPFAFTTPVLASGKEHVIEVRTVNLVDNSISPLWSDTVLVQTTSCFTLARAHTGSGTDPIATPANSSGCGAGLYHPGESISLSATPGSGSMVGSWSGTDSSSSSATVTSVTMPASMRTVTVNYVANNQCYPLSLGHTGSGADVVASPSGSSGCSSGQYHFGELITLTASPSNGYFAGSWTGTNLDVSASKVNTLTMPASASSAAANYLAIPNTCFILTLTNTGSGSVPGSSPANSTGCPTGQYLAGTLINLSAVPASGYSVESWTGADAVSTATINAVTMPASSHTVTVNYSTYLQTCVSIASQITPGAAAGRVDISPAPNCAGGSQYVIGTSLQFSAVANPGYAFSSWNGSAAGTNNVVTLTAAAGMTINANFRSECYNLTASGSPSLAGSVSVSPAPNCNNATQYSFGTPLQLIANPAAGYSVIGWSGTANDASLSTSNAVNMPSRALNITARFAVLPPTCFSLNIVKTGSGNPPLASPLNSPGCPAGAYTAGEFVSLQAFPGKAYGFGSWNGTDDDASTQLANMVTMPASSHTVTANYVPLPAVCFGLTILSSGLGVDPTASPASSVGCANGEFIAGQAITLAAWPDIGNMVTSWAGTRNDASVALVNKVIMPAAPQSVSVTYGAIPAACFALSLSHSGSGIDPTANPANSTGCLAGQYHAGELIALTATPDLNNRVGSWTGSDDNTSVANTNKLTMPAKASSVLVDYSSSWPAVLNDEIGSAITISPPISFSSIPVTTATSASDDPSIPACDSDKGLQSVWYKITAPSLGELHVDTFGSNYDTLVALWTGTRGNLNMVDCNDDKVLWINVQSEINSMLAPGGVYYLEVIKYNSAFQAASLGSQASRKPPSATPAPGALAVDTLSLNVQFTPLDYLHKGSVFDDTDSNIRYHGAWTSNTGSGPYQDSSHSNTVLGDNAWFAFEGTNFNLVYGAGPDRGSADVFIDNIWTASLNQYNAGTLFQTSWSSPKLLDGIHIVQVVNADGNTLDIDAITTPISAPQNLSVSAATQTSLSLSWDDTSANESGFNIYRWSFDGLNWGFTYLDKVGVGVKTYTQNDLECGSALNYYQVAAYNASGESSRAAWVQGTTSPCNTVPNDDFNSAKVTTPVSYTDTIQTIGATRALDDPEIAACNLAPAAATVWYQFTAQASGQLSLDTIGSDYDTVLALWSGSRGNLTPLGCSDDRWANGNLIDRQSELKAGVIAGRVYSIEVGQYDGALSAAQSLVPAKPGPTGLSAGGTLHLHASLANYTISGNAGVAGAILNFNDGAALSVSADASGNYTLPVSVNWSGIVTPTKAGYVFTPSSRSYSNVSANKTGENYTAAISDFTPPAAITNLEAVSGSAIGSVDLRWTAVGDDGFTGKATSYLVRYSLTAITTESAWNAATPVISGIPIPGMAGSGQGMTVAGLPLGQNYYFSVRARDEVPNIGALSNSPSALPKAVNCNNSLAVNGLKTKSLCGEGTLSGFSGTKVYATISGRRSGFITKTIGISFVKGIARLCFSTHRGGAIYFSANNGRTWIRVWNQLNNSPPCMYISSSGLYAWAKK